MKILRLRFAALVFTILIVCFTLSCTSLNSVPAEEAAEAWFNLGNAYTELGRNEDAVKAFTKARTLDPSLLSAGFNLSRVYILMKQYDNGLEQLDLLLETDPGNRQVLETKAWVMHLQGDDAAALEIYDQILLEFSNSRNSLYNSAIMLSEAGEYDEALRRFSRLYELFPEEVGVVFEIAFLNSELGHVEESLLWLEKRLSDNPQDTDALELKGDMHVMQKLYAEAVMAYRKIVNSDTTEESDPDKEIKISKDLEGRVYFKIAEILLTRMEDFDGGLAALEKCTGSGWRDSERFDSLLSSATPDWYEAAAGLIGNELPDEKKAGSDDSVPAENE